MLVAVRGLCGVGRIPHHRISAEQCILRFGARIHQLKGAGGTFHAVALSDLPEPERLACLRRQIENLHLDPGTYDDAAHADFVQAAPSRRERAERKAAIARLLVSLGPDVGWADRLRLVRGQFGDKGTSKPRLKAPADGRQGFRSDQLCARIAGPLQGQDGEGRDQPGCLAVFSDHDPRCRAGVSANPGMARHPRRWQETGLGGPVLPHFLPALAGSECGAAQRGTAGQRRSSN